MRQILYHSQFTKEILKLERWNKSAKDTWLINGHDGSQIQAVCDGINEDFILPYLPHQFPIHLQNTKNVVFKQNSGPNL